MPGAKVVNRAEVASVVCYAADGFNLENGL